MNTLFENALVLFVENWDIFTYGCSVPILATLTPWFVFVFLFFFVFRQINIPWNSWKSKVRHISYTLNMIRLHDVASLHHYKLLWRRKFLKFVAIFVIFHWKRVCSIIWTNFNPLNPKMFSVPSLVIIDLFKVSKFCQCNFDI